MILRNEFLMDSYGWKWEVSNYFQWNSSCLIEKQMYDLDVGQGWTDIHDLQTLVAIL
jgi:hypothetical protein